MLKKHKNNDLLTFKFDTTDSFIFFCDGRVRILPLHISLCHTVNPMERGGKKTEINLPSKAKN